MESIASVSDDVPAFAALSDDDLIARVRDLAACERRASVALIRSLVEFDTRRLYLREGCPSLFVYCTHVLHLSEGSAYNRIETARAALRYPMVLEALDRGDLTLTAVRLLAPHLTAANHAAVLAAARHRSKLELQELIASVNPRPAVPTVIRRLASQPVTDATLTVAATHEPEPSMAALEAGNVPGSAAGPASSHPPASSSGRAVLPEEALSRESDAAALEPPQSPATVITPLAPELYRLQVTLARETHAKLRRAQALARHALPRGNIGAILDRALTLLIDDLERRRFARVAAPRPRRGENTPSGRYIPAVVRRAVWQRDQGCCAFVGRTGRCRETAFLEFHHLTPYAAGGTATAENIQLRCRAHNQYEGRLAFGESLVRERPPAWVVHRTSGLTPEAGYCGAGSLVPPPPASDTNGARAGPAR
jgi:5-methylcytosine-specific restriction endonuclease McrA